LNYRLGWSGGHVLVTVGPTRTMVEIEVRHEGQLLVLREDDAPVPAAGSIDIRANGLWLSLVDERDGRWTVGLEAFALAVDDPDDERGDLVALGLDLEFDEGRLIGDLLVGDEVIGVDEPATWVAG
jgi:hypothetical protein